MKELGVYKEITGKSLWLKTLVVGDIILEDYGFNTEEHHKLFL